MSNELVFKYEADGQPMELTYDVVKQFIASDANITIPEFRMFGELCKARGLNPFLKEAYLVKYGSQPAQLIVSKDVVFRRADLHPAYDGMEDGVIVWKDNKVEYRSGCLVLQGEGLLGAWAKVFRKDRSYPTYVALNFNECAPRTREGALNPMWATKGAMMCNKVAKVRALREAFPSDFTGMYDESEFEDVPPESDPIIIQDEPSESDTVSFDDI